MLDEIPTKTIPYSTLLQIRAEWAKQFIMVKRTVDGRCHNLKFKKYRHDNGTRVIPCQAHANARKFPLVLNYMPLPAIQIMFPALR